MGVTTVVGSTQPVSEFFMLPSETCLAKEVGTFRDGTWEWNLQANTIAFSPEWKMMLGYQENEVGDSPVEWMYRIHPEDIELVRNRLAAHLSGQTSQLQTEHRLLHRDGTYRWVHLRAHSIRDQEGKLYRMVGFQVDVTPYKQTLRTTQLQRASVQSVADALPLPALVVTTEGMILYVNRSYDDSCGIKSEELVGQSYLDYFPDIGILNGGARQQELSLHNASGETLWLRAHIHPLTDHLSGLYLICLLDVTDHKLLELELSDLLRHTQLPTPLSTPQPSLTSVFTFIETNYRNPIGLKEVAKAVGYSPAYLTSTVQRSTGRTVNQWITEYRMAEARLLLLKTDQPIQQIALAVGYQGVEHFIRQFRQLHEVTPKVWRKQHAQKASHG